jgi:hypothetical protein
MAAPIAREIGSASTPWKFSHAIITSSSHEFWITKFWITKLRITNFLEERNDGWQ